MHIRTYYPTVVLSDIHLGTSHYYSLSQAIKQKVKSAVSYISDFEKVLVEFARARKCDGVICGHIHHPANACYDGIHYLNSGDWVESLSALAEDADGNRNIIEYHNVPAGEHEEKQKMTLINTAS